MTSYARGVLHPPGPGDAIFCTSTAGRLVVEKSFAAAARGRGRSRRRGARRSACELPVIPLGVDVDHLRTGDRAATRARLGIPDDAIVLLALGRFTEYDKMDLFPLVQVFARARARRPAGSRPLRLLLAGARQGTKTPEMLAAVGAGLRRGRRAHPVRRLRRGRQAPPAGRLRHLRLALRQPAGDVRNLGRRRRWPPACAPIVSDFDGYKDTVPPDAGIRVKTRWHADQSFLSELGPLALRAPAAPAARPERRGRSRRARGGDRRAGGRRSPPRRHVPPGARARARALRLARGRGRL